MIDWRALIYTILTMLAVPAFVVTPFLLQLLYERYGEIVQNIIYGVLSLAIGVIVGILGYVVYEGYKR